MGGPIPKFGDYHIWKIMFNVGRAAPLGRKKLASMLDIGEGSVRTILSILQEDGLIFINKNGVGLTREGLECWNAVKMDVSPIRVDGLTIDENDCAVRVPGAARSVLYGCEERDAAIKAGATGATTLVCSNNVLIFPGSNYPVDPKIEKVLRGAFEIMNDDVVIVGTGTTPAAAEKGAVIAGLDLLGGLQIHRELREILSHRSTGSELLALAFAIHDLVGGLPVCAKSRDNLGIRIENGTVIDNAYTGAVLEEVINVGTTIRKVAVSGPYKGIRVIVTPIELDNRVIAAIGVVDIRSMAGADNLIRLRKEDEFGDEGQ
ncbi:MAG: DUF2111 domain-containing protein [Candidatus Methanoplasma sp.]|jgi:predicted transcriptional regulator|nr:DUF2111 domain-containing protein [Candidatus Methanoplasma sp.]